MLGRIVFNSVPLEETVRLGLVEFMTEIKGSDRLLEHLKVKNDHCSKFSNLSNWKEEA